MPVTAPGEVIRPHGAGLFEREFLRNGALMQHVAPGQIRADHAGFPKAVEDAVAVRDVKRSARSHTPGSGLQFWGGWIRTNEWRIQSPLPYHLATPHRSPERLIYRRFRFLVAATYRPTGHFA